jgi:hypothetical protein
VSSLRAARIRPSLDTILAAGLGLALLVLGFLTTGGFDGSVSISSGNTWAEIVLTVVGAAALGALILLGARGPAWGAGAVALLAALTALTALSIVWSVVPDASWQAANLTLAYLMTFVAGAALARIAAGRWRSLVAAVAVAAVLLSLYALLAKIFPGSLAASDTGGRLQAPLGYWNATGAMAAMGIAPCLWGFSRPDGPRLLRGLAAPGATVLAAVVVLSFSRTALATVVLTLVLWLVLAPGRLRSVLLIALSAAGAAVICLWSVGHPALSTDGAGLAARTSAGHTFGIVLLIVVVVELAAGLAAARAVDTIKLAEPVRRRTGVALIGLGCLLPAVAVFALAASSRGLTGQITHAWHSLTNVNSVVGESASRITQFGSSRPLYWSQGITVGEHALFKGVGALGYATARTQYVKSSPIVGHAHSYVIQTFADLGLLGLVVSLALLLAWGRAAWRALAPGASWSELSAERSHERSGLLALALFVLGFGLSSAFDWTWYFPALAVPALLAAGWLAGRGPLLGPVGRAVSRLPLLSRPGALSACSALMVVSLACAWLIWQPLRSADDASAVFSATSTKAAFDDARAAQAADPLALQPHFVLSQLYVGQGNLAAARAELVNAVRLQPRNYESWYALGSYDLAQHQPKLAISSLNQAFALNPTVFATQQRLSAAQQQAAAGG